MSAADTTGALPSTSCAWHSIKSVEDDAQPRQRAEEEIIVVDFLPRVGSHSGGRAGRRIFICLAC